MLWSAGCADPLTVGDDAYAAQDYAIAVARWEGRALKEAGRQQRYARALVKLGRLDDARAAIDAVPEAARDATGQLVVGVLAAEQGDLEAALGAFEAGLMLSPMPELAVNRCVALRSLGQAALEPCREAIRLAPDDPRGFLALAEEGIAQRAPAVAEEALQAAQELLEGDQELWPWAAALNAQVGRWEPACALGVGAGVVSLEIAQACAAAGRLDAARGMGEALAEAQPEAVALLLRLATDEAEATPIGPARAKAVERAQRWARRVDEPFGVGVLNDLGRLHALEGEEALAEARWREAIALAPREAAPRLNLAQALWQRGAEAAAMALIEAQVGLETPEAVSFGLLQARWQAERGQLEPALSWLRLAQARCEAWGHAGCATEVGYERALREAEAGRGAAALAALEDAAATGGAALLARASREAAFEAIQDEVNRMRMDLEAH